MDASIPHGRAAPRLDAPNTSSLTVPRLNVASRTKVAPRLDTSIRTRTAVPRLDAGIHHSGVVPRLEAPCETRRTDPRLDVRSQKKPQEYNDRAAPRLDAPNPSSLTVPRLDVASRTKVVPRLDTLIRTTTNGVPRLDAAIYHSGAVSRLEAPCETRRTVPRLDVRSQTQDR